MIVAFVGSPGRARTYTWSKTWNAPMKERIPVKKMDGVSSGSVIESLIEAMRPPPKVRGNLAFAPDDIMTAIDSLFPSQELNRESHAVHGAGFYDPGRGLVAVREDVGRHNALDKLAGALARERLTAEQGIVPLTSRVSVEMVQNQPPSAQLSSSRCRRRRR